IEVRTPSAVAPATTRKRPATWRTTVSSTCTRSRSFMRATSLVTPSAVRPLTPAPMKRSMTRLRLSRSRSPAAVKGVGRTEYTPSSFKRVPPGAICGYSDTVSRKRLLLKEPPDLVTMSPNAFIGGTLPPTDDELSAQLGAARELWDELLALLALPVQEWHSYSPKAGWSLKLKLGTRTILYLAPCHGSFQVAFVLGAKAVEAARQAKLAKAVLRIINRSEEHTSEL